MRIEDIKAGMLFEMPNGKLQVLAVMNFCVAYCEEGFFTVRALSHEKFLEYVNL